MFSRWSNSHHNKENDSLQQESKIVLTSSLIVAVMRKYNQIKELRAAIGPLSGRSLKYCTDACLRRYLEARNWNADKSKKMLEETLKWRSTYKPEEIRWHEVAVEGETGKVYRASFHDRHDRTVLILRPGKQNTTSLDNQLRHLVYLIENAVLNLPETQEQMAWLIDFTGWTLSTSVPIKSARDTINLLQNHYPERLTIAFLYNPPRIFEAFWKIVKYFMDAKTFQKVKFVYPKNTESVELMRSYFDEENLPTEFGGKAVLEYNHEEFSKQMSQDDIKSANLWGFDDKLQCISNGHSGSDVAPEPVCLAPSAS
ncbi:random slug protein 5 isoform X1 [Gossypium australe]|uniref:Random slug protein 5 isoform X1 n=1 Tax=Gossypium australe TaxID=47621 RepID=A0A5B6X7K1_9ROSI|nr:random slug protein 5 isoform X1 [Gossypium australe]